MPTYAFKNTKTGEVFEEFMSISAREQYFKDNPHLEHVLVVPQKVADVVRMGMKKPDDGFRDVLKKIKKKHRGSKINTW